VGQLQTDGVLNSLFHSILNIQVAVTQFVAEKYLFQMWNIISQHYIKIQVCRSHFVMVKYWIFQLAPVQLNKLLQVSISFVKSKMRCLKWMHKKIMRRRLQIFKLQILLFWKVVTEYTTVRDIIHMFVNSAFLIYNWS